MNIRITTTDAAFANRFGTGLAADSSTVVSVPDSAIERVTFSSRGMIRFDMAQVAGGELPKGWGNRWTMYPASRIVS